MMFACPATNHGAISECGNIVSCSLLSSAFSVELAVACPPPDDCPEPSGASASVCPAHVRKAGTALSANSIHIQIVFRDSTFSASPRLVLAHRRRANGRIPVAIGPRARRGTLQILRVPWYHVPLPRRHCCFVNWLGRYSGPSLVYHTPLGYTKDVKCR
jgi:hypothetical protein